MLKGTLKRNKGITLIALVVTIIVLLILAGISIAMLTGQNGILNRASEAQEKTGTAQTEELVKLSVTDALTQGLGSLTDVNLKTALNNNIGEGKYEISGDATDGWTVTVDGKEFKIDSTGKIGKEPEPEPTPTPEPGPEFSECTWTEINELAKEIAKDNTITNQTANVTKTINGKEYAAKVGDEKTITIASKDYKVRILGFNHDTLESGATAYNDSSITKAGISFEFVTVLPTAQMNTGDTNENGWGGSLMRTNLNSTSAVDGMVNLSNIESVIGSNIIKSVTKSYIKTYNDASSVTTCNDKLWLLACSEVWNNGYNGEGTYGYANASEGSQYKFYADINATWNANNTKLVKYYSSNSSGWWWLRSPSYSNSGNDFCDLDYSGYCSYYNAGSSGDVAPGFAI